MSQNYNVLLNKIENAIRKSKNFSLTKDECKKLFREEKIPDSEREIERVIKRLEEEKNTKIRYKANEKAFGFTSKFNIPNKDGLKKYLEDPTNDPLEESQDLFDEYPGIKEDLTALEKEGYLKKFAVTDKKSNKANRVVIFGKNPNDPIEQMNLAEEFKEFKDVRPEKTGKSDAPRPDNMPAPVKKRKTAKTITGKAQDTSLAIKNMMNT